MNLEL